MKNVVVTGCAGFVGSWICDKAIEAGYNVIGIDNLSSGVNFTPKQVQFHKIDVNNDIKSILKSADIVIHAAAYAELRHNWENKAERDRSFLSNEMATRSILEQMPDVPIIFLSTGSVYGSLSMKIIDRPLIETDALPETVESPYAASKLACESYVAAWAFKRNTPWYCLRLVNQVGARGHRGVITDFCRMANEKQHIHAADNGEQTKNWVSVEDTANAIIRILNQREPVPSGVYNITSEEKWSWRNIIDVMYEVFDNKNPLSEKPFDFSFENKLAGAIGDPVNLHVSGEKFSYFYICNKSIKKSVIEALNFNKWGNKS